MANGYLHLTTDYGHTMAKSLILYSTNSYPNTKSQIYFPLKCPKSLVFYTNNSWWMKNHGQGTQWKHVCRNLNRKYPKYPSTYSAHSPVIWDILEKKVFITCPLSMHLTKLSLWESLLRSAKSVKRSRNIWKTWRPSFNRQFFMFKIGKNLQVAKSSVQYPCLMWEDARKKSEKSLDEETIECVFGNRIFGWIWLDFFVRRLRLWFWSAAKIENKKVFYFFPMNRRRVMLSELDDCYHWKWAKLVLTRHTKACDC